MSDYLEVDFLKIGDKHSGDAVLVRYFLDGVTTIHSIDGGYTDDAKKVIAHIEKFYGDVQAIDHLVVTHPDRDHAAGVKGIIENFPVKNVWMNRPWMYSTELVDRFSRFTNVQNLEKRLREIYPFLNAAEEAALEKGIPIREAFQGTSIGEFVVLAPSRSRFLDLIVDSEKSPQSVKIEEARASVSSDGVITALKKLINALWGDEVFSTEDTAAENEMSIVQYANICGSKVLLTGDAGRAALQDAIDFSARNGIELSGINKFQVPHHGSRRNISAEILDTLLGARLKDKPNSDGNRFSAIISAAKNDPDHPRKAVIRAMWHRGGRVVSTEENGIRSHAGSAPHRDGWVVMPSLPYPTTQEE